MAAVTFDGQSLIVDSRRIWLISGTLYPSRLPRGLWKSRLRMARAAGLNCVMVPLFWNVHEPQPSVFRFKEEADIRAFLEMVHAEGMYAVLRPGPYVGAGWDMGGLPGWLLEEGGMKLRQDDPRFLQAVARYFEALMEQVSDLQITADRPGPIVMMQVEHEWFSSNPEQGEDYHGQLVRFLRESGCQVPLLNTNNLWQQVPGTIDGWIGYDHLLANCRQLRTIRSDAPVFVAGLPTCEIETWNHPAGQRVTADALLRRLAEASAAGAMVNLDPIAGGINVGFRGGRLLGDDDHYVTTRFAADAPIADTGQRGEKYTAIKRLAPFLSSFGRLMASVNPSEHHAVAATGLTVIQQSGSQGKVVFVLRDETSDAQQVEICTPDGQTVPVILSDENLAWFVVNAAVDGVGRIDVTNLRPWASIGRRMLVLFGPAGSPGLISIDSTLYSVTVPTGSEPLVLRHDGAPVVILSTEQVNAAYVEKQQLYVGCCGVSEAGEPEKHPNFSVCSVIDGSGAVKRIKPAAIPKSVAPKLGKFDIAGLHAYAAGTAPRFATLHGPRSLEACGADYGYGWYRIRLKRKKSGKVNLLLPQAGDRLHLYIDGRLQGIVGSGAEATSEPLPLTLGKDAELVVLADNFGRFAEGMSLDQPRGIHGPLLDVKPLRLPKAVMTLEPRVDVFALSGFIPRSSLDDRGPYPRWTWTLASAGKEPLVLMLRGHRPRSVVLLNGTPVAIDIDHHVTTTLLLPPGKRGANRITLAQIEPAGDRQIDPVKCCTLYQAVETLSEGAAWWYARWQLPENLQYSPAGKTGDAPAFFRAQFTLDAVSSRPLCAEFSAGSKGQIYLNGHNLGRYFLATHRNKKVGPQRRFWLPEPWLVQGVNELVVFDEHGKPPGVKLSY